MIVTPDFIDHHKTVRLIRLTGDDAAPLACFRLWGHCQQRKQWRFPKMTAEDLADVVRWKVGKISAFDALSQAKFIDPLPDGGFVVHDWAKVNASLVSAWKNGKSGGRPKRKGNPPETDRLTEPNPPSNRIESDRPDQIDLPDGIDKTHQTRPPEAAGKGAVAVVLSSGFQVGLRAVEEAKKICFRADANGFERLRKCAEEVLTKELASAEFIPPFLEWFCTNEANKWMHEGQPIRSKPAAFRGYLAKAKR